MGKRNIVVQSISYQTTTELVSPDIERSTYKQEASVPVSASSSAKSNVKE